LVQAYAVESTEIATYESLYAAASAVGDTKTAALAKEIQAEEEATAKRLFARIAPVAALAIQVGVSEGRN
jgi:ferritin-like metal-binding protein YciE